MRVHLNWLHYIGLVLIVIGVIFFFTVFLGPYGLAIAIAGWIIFVIGYLWPSKTPQETAKKVNKENA